ncbi:MAG: hypothetical protein ACLS3L_00650 [Eubacterium sp.]|uniref:hypothetical protein n=1 Tax=Eubacterium sp. TaxID=142586 RepID=UPI0025F5C848|nr:hypothetical protein [uncultured Eubacterium sp.]
MIIIQFINYICQMFEGTNITLTDLYQGFDVLKEAIGFISFFIPMQPIITCVGIIVASYSWRLFVSLFKMLWSVIPLL